MSENSGKHHDMLVKEFAVNAFEQSLDSSMENDQKFATAKMSVRDLDLQPTSDLKNSTGMTHSSIDDQYDKRITPRVLKPLSDITRALHKSSTVNSAAAVHKKNEDLNDVESSVQLDLMNNNQIQVNIVDESGAVYFNDTGSPEQTPK